MNVGTFKLNEHLVFTANTHNPATGEAQDADVDPSYRVYKDGGASPVAAGTMALFDSGNTVGLYLERIQLTALAGFENGVSYAIYISATVNGVTGTISHSFKIDTGEALFPAGAIQYTYTVTNVNNGFPIPGVDVWISTDITGLNVIWRGQTDAFGVARDVMNNLPALDPGTYYFWKSRAGYSTSEAPDQEVVS